MNRRSFLALIAGALAVEPARLLGVRAAAPLAMKPRPATYLPYMLWENLIVEPDKETTETAFFPPLPKDFSIHTLAVYLPSDIPLADMRALFDALTLQVTTDGQQSINRLPIWTAFRCLPLSVQPSVGAGTIEQLTPAIVPHEQFSVQLAGPAVQLSRPAQVQVIIGGQVRVL